MALARLAAAAKDFLARRVRGSARSSSRSGLGSLRPQGARQTSGLGMLSRRRADRMAERLAIPTPPDYADQAPEPEPMGFLAKLAQFFRTGRLPDREFAADLEKALRREAQGLPPVPPPREPALAEEPEPPEEYIDTLGRDLGYHEEEWAQQQAGQQFVSSSNVYSYYYQPESRYSGILYVTFLAAQPKGSDQRPSGPGPTYAYYNVTRSKYAAFRKQAAASAGGAVWDHLRVRGSLWNHQHNYRLVHATGEYVPRRVTKWGFKTRALRPIGAPRQVRREDFRRSTLPPEPFTFASEEAREERARERPAWAPNRATPARGTPNRGTP